LEGALEERDQYPQTLEVRLELAGMLTQRAALLDEMNRRDAAIAALVSIDDLTSGMEDTRVDETVARALGSKAALLEKQGRVQEALASYKFLSDKFGRSRIAAVTDAVFHGQLRRAELLVRAHEVNQALEVFSSLAAWSRAEDARLRRHGVHAILRKGRLLHRLGRIPDAVACYDEVLEHYGRALEAFTSQQDAALYTPARDILTAVEAASANKANALHTLGQLEQAEKARQFATSVNIELTRRLTYEPY
jgi:tetratricopeptide (TPR) repeat protein